MSLPAVLIGNNLATGRVGRVDDGRGGTVCGCYPECRIDCDHRDQCLDEMPEYQTKLDRAKRYAADVRRRKQVAA